MHGVDRRADFRQVGHLRRELERIGWVQYQGRRWSLTAEGAELAKSTPSEVPSVFSLRLCLAGERAFQGVVSRLLERLWALSPQRQGAVLLPKPSLRDVPAQPGALEAWLQDLLRAQRDLLTAQVPGLDPPREMPPPSAAAGMLRRWPHWEKLAPSRRKSHVLQLVEERMLTWLFGVIAPADEVKVWQSRMDWAGLTLLARWIPGVRGKVWFPVGAFRDRGSPSFVPVAGIEYEGRTYYCYDPTGPEAESSFIDGLYDAYVAAQRLERTEYVSLPVVRDLVCYRLRIAHERFQTLLQRVFPRALGGELPYGLSLEVDIPPNERVRRSASLPIIVDHIPRHIIAMRRRPPPGGGTS
jgi:hypothetical protein